MIIVISDDFTGGAEIAGLGIRYGLNVVLLTDELTGDDLKNGTDILIIATDTRSMSNDKAYATMHRIMTGLEDAGYDWIYKKTDSVFRGHILTELSAMMKASGKKRALLVASNPQMGRKIIRGIYYINDLPLNETEFARDPDFSITTSNVLELLGREKDVDIHLLEAEQPLQQDGIFLGEAGVPGDLKKFAKKVNESILPAGAAGFFSALLEEKGYHIVPGKEKKVFDDDKNYLIVLGSANPEGKISHLEAREKGAGLSFMSEEIFLDKESSSAAMEEWIREVCRLYDHHKKVIIEIPQPVVSDKPVSRRLKEQIAYLVKEVLKRVNIQELIVDGGATAFAVVSGLHFHKFYPEYEVAPGIVRMRVHNISDLCLTIKPGSYPMPDEILGTGIPLITNH